MKQPSETDRLQSELRQQAEAVLRHVPQDSANQVEADLDRLLHEFRVHQVELELQNEELRRSQEELQLARDKYADLYDFAPVGYLTLDSHGTIREANLTAATLLGVDLSTLVGTPLSHFVVRDHQDVFYLHRRHVMDQETPHVCDLEMQRADGTTFVAHLESRAWGDTVEGVGQCRTILSDITALKQEEAARREAERLASLGTFAAGLAHELNNPLCAIASTAEHAYDGLASAQAGDEMAACLADILEDAERCAQIVKRVLNLARQGSRDKAPLALHPLIQAAHAFTQYYAQQHGVSSGLTLAPLSPRIVANQEDIDLVLVNLIRNAVEASPEGGHIEIETAVEGDHVQIRVCDTGVGLSEAARQRVFDPFYTTREEAGGTGLGLSLTHRIIVDHGGTIELQSTRDHGTTVLVQLPLAPPDGPQAT